jgi:hypothetical protein
MALVTEESLAFGILTSLATVDIAGRGAIGRNLVVVLLGLVDLSSTVTNASGGKPLMVEVIFWGTLVSDLIS